MTTRVSRLRQAIEAAGPIQDVEDLLHVPEVQAALDALSIGPALALDAINVVMQMDLDESNPEDNEPSAVEVMRYETHANHDVKVVGRDWCAEPDSVRTYDLTLDLTFTAKGDSAAHRLLAKIGRDLAVIETAFSSDDVSFDFAYLSDITETLASDGDVDEREVTSW